jgi:hypothetical protein
MQVKLVLWHKGITLLQCKAYRNKEALMMYSSSPAPALQVIDQVRYKKQEGGRTCVACSTQHRGAVGFLSYATRRTQTTTPERGLLLVF